MLEKEAAQYPVDLFRISENGFQQGLLILDSSLPATRKSELLQAAGVTEPNRHSELLQPENPGLPGRNSMLRHISLELDRVRKSRLPCALLLIRQKGDIQGHPFHETATLLENHLPGNAFLAQHDESTLSLLLPGYNLQKSLRQAAAIMELLSALQIEIGLSVCMFRNIPTPETFVTMTEIELKRAATDNKDICHSMQDGAEDSCQVTAEERSQLFSFLNRPKS